MFVIGYHQNESSQQHTQNLTIERHKGRENSAMPLAAQNDVSLNRGAHLTSKSAARVFVRDGCRHADHLLVEVGVPHLRRVALLPSQHQLGLLVVLHLLLSPGGKVL